jgi:ribonuclease HI
MSRPLLVVDTDGSCIDQANIVRRMAGIGVFFGHEHKHNVSEPLLGDKQTSARAELAAVVRALEQAEKIDGARPLLIRCDNKYAILETNRILEPKKHKAIHGERLNGDLLKQLARLIMLRKAPVTIEWVQGHSGAQGNESADGLARWAAEAAYARRHGKFSGQ